MYAMSQSILIVEDDESLRKMLAVLFEDLGYQVKTVQNGEQALSILKDTEFDLIFTDMFMPKMNGIDLIKKCQQEFPSMKSILFSGGGRGIEAEHNGTHIKYGNTELDVDLFVKKPFNVSEVIDSVNSMLKN